MTRDTEVQRHYGRPLNNTATNNALPYVNHGIVYAYVERESRHGDVMTACALLIDSRDDELPLSEIIKTRSIRSDMLQTVCKRFSPVLREV